MDFSFTDLVNPLQGSLSGLGSDLPPTLPLVQHPDGTQAWTLVNADDPKVFDPGHPRLRGLRYVPLGFELCPQTGPLVVDPGSAGVRGEGPAGEPFALGLYPLCPGSGDYVLGSPLFPRALVIESSNPGAGSPVVARRTLGNLVLTAPRVSRADLFDLGWLTCERVSSS